MHLRQRKECIQRSLGEGVWYIQGAERRTEKMRVVSEEAGEGMQSRDHEKLWLREGSKCGSFS